VAARPTVITAAARNSRGEVLHLAVLAVLAVPVWKGLADLKIVFMSSSFVLQAVCSRHSP
jgi:hypothetical protein